MNNNRKRFVSVCLSIFVLFVLVGHTAYAWINNNVVYGSHTSSYERNWNYMTKMEAMNRHSRTDYMTVRVRAKEGSAVRSSRSTHVGSGSVISTSYYGGGFGANYRGEAVGAKFSPYMHW